MKVAIVGAGYVGLVSGACLAEVGHECVCVDSDPVRVSRILQGVAPIHEAGLESMLERLVGNGLTASSDLRAAVLQSDVTLIAVGTPYQGGAIDLSYICGVAAEIGRALREKTAYHVVIVKSTVVPGTTDDVVRPILEEHSGKRAGSDFGLGMNPEFLTEGVAIRDFMNPDRIVLGGIDERTIGVLDELYAPFAGPPILRTNNKTAEMIKYASNATLATLISFSNEIANLCESLGGLDAAEVMAGVHEAHYFTTVLDDGRRVRAPITAFLWPGCGFGGSCLPKDVKALAVHGRKHGQPMEMLDTVIKINEGQPGRIVRLLESQLGPLNGKRVCILGLAFKEDTDDVRESPAIPIIRDLVSRGAVVGAFDPIAAAPARMVLGDLPVTYHENLEAAVSYTDAVVLVTRWDEFRRVPDLLAALPVPPVVVDGRRMLDKRCVARYSGIGL